MARDPIRILYYPDFWVDFNTLKKAILLFDELHFMDRPSFTFRNFGTIAAASPLRQYEASFRDNGVPLFVHSPQDGPVYGDFYERVKADVNDLEFLKRFQNGLRDSVTFRNLQIARGNYGAAGDQDDVAQGLLSVDLANDLRTHESPIALFEDKSIRPFDHSTPTGRAKNLVSDAVICSAKINFALNAGTRSGFFPLADAKPYGDLLGAKYARAAKALAPAADKLQLTDISFAIFDELVPTPVLAPMNLGEVIEYRKASTVAREEFLEHLNAIQAQQTAVGADGDYVGAIDKLITTEIRPAVTTFKNKLRAINEGLWASVAKGAVGALGGGSFVSIFVDLSWSRILALSAAALAYVVQAQIDVIVAERAAKRECSMSYLLSLDP